MWTRSRKQCAICSRGFRRKRATFRRTSGAICRGPRRSCTWPLPPRTRTSWPTPVPSSTPSATGFRAVRKGAPSTRTGGLGDIRRARDGGSLLAVRAVRRPEYPRARRQALEGRRAHAPLRSGRAVRQARDQGGSGVRRQRSGRDARRLAPLQGAPGIRKAAPTFRSSSGRRTRQSLPRPMCSRDRHDARAEQDFEASLPRWVTTPIVATERPGRRARAWPPAYGGSSATHSSA